MGENIPPAALVTPASTAEREAARRALFARLALQQPVGASRWTRDELYDDEQDAPRTAPQP